MRKNFVVKLALAGSVGLAAALAGGTAGAADCSSCHTMHNSQNGAPMRTFGTNLPMPRPVLLLDSCVGCHTGLNADDPSVAGGTVQPKVNAEALPTYTGSGVANKTLAGGDFYWVGAGGEAKGHNVVGVDNADSILTAPPGGVAPAQVQCAGTSGCHGNVGIADPLASLQGAHHKAHNDVTDATLDGSEPGLSFRYMLGVLGREDTNWEWTAGAGDHNIYSGEARTSALANISSANGLTISELCARCHGAYHNTVGGNDSFGINTNNGAFAGAGSWIRHPTDYAMGMTAGSQYNSYKVYSLEAPVGRIAANLGGAIDDVTSTTNNRIVLCVSCHRAHGSPYNDALRWNYNSMQVGTGVTSGCMNCHLGK